MKTFEQCTAQCRTNINRHRDEISKREELLNRVLPLIQGYAEEIELMKFELYSSMLEIRAKRCLTRFMQDIHEIVGGQLTADPEDTGVFECGLVGRIVGQL
jgi:hypothetical protein